MINEIINNKLNSSIRGATYYLAGSHVEPIFAKNVEQITGGNLSY